MRRTKRRLSDLEEDLSVRAQRYTGVGSQIARGFIKHLPLIVQARIGSAPKIVPNSFSAMYEDHMHTWRAAMQDIPQPRVTLEDVAVQTPQQTVQTLIDQNTTRILSLLQQDPALSARELAFQTQLPKLQDLCKEFESLRDQYQTAISMKRPQQPLRLINAITESTLKNNIEDVSKEKGHVQVDPQEVVLRVAIYDCRTRVQSQEFLILGSQSLAELKDVILCLTDRVYGCKYSSSSCFLIEDTFYDDLRGSETSEATCLRYSDPIIEWVKQKKRYVQPGLTRFRQSEMEGCRVGDLDIRLNSFYYYVHHGQCTHVVMFKEIRVFDSTSDCQNRNVYPLLIYQPRQKVRKCSVCDIYAAKYVTYGDRFAPESPYFYCNTCYQQFHYDHEGNLLYEDFKVFPYYHD